MSTPDIKSGGAAPDSVAHFNLVHYRSQQVVDLLEVPLDLIKQDGVIFHHDTMVVATPYGEAYTLDPMDNLDVQVMRDLYKALQELDKPTRYIYVLQSRCDELTAAVERLFGINAYKVIDSHEAMVDLMAFHAGKNHKHEPKLVHRPRIGSMYEKVVPQPVTEDEL